MQEYPYIPCAEHWQLSKEPSDYFFSFPKYCETDKKDFAFFERFEK